MAPRGCVLLTPSHRHPGLTFASSLTTLPPRPSARKLPRRPTRLAFCRSLFSPSRAPSHPSLSARPSRRGFRWHLPAILIHLTAMFTFLQPSAFVRFLLLQPNKDFPLKSTHSSTVRSRRGGRCAHCRDPSRGRLVITNKAGFRQKQRADKPEPCLGPPVPLGDRRENKQAVGWSPSNNFALTCKPLPEAL